MQKLIALSKRYDFFVNSFEGTQGLGNKLPMDCNLQLSGIRSIIASRWFFLQHTAQNRLQTNFFVNFTPLDPAGN
jgi:hypothetical protein